MKQVDVAQLKEGAVTWEAVCFIIPLSRHEDTARTRLHIGNKAKGQIGEGTNLILRSREPGREGRK